VFRRGRVNLSTTVVEDAESDSRVNGELTEPAPEEHARSEALAASLDEEAIPSFGYDGPVADTEIADLGTVLGSEMTSELDDVIEKTRVELNGDSERAGDAQGTAEPVAESGGRVRRSRTRVPASV
jgi:hypothetical protein